MEHRSREDSDGAVFGGIPRRSSVSSVTQQWGPVVCGVDTDLVMSTRDGDYSKQRCAAFDPCREAYRFGVRERVAETARGGAVNRLIPFHVVVDAAMRVRKIRFVELTLTLDLRR